MFIGMAMICLGPNPTLSADAIARELAQRWPSLPEVTVDHDADDNMIGLQIGKEDVIIAEMPGPIPWSDLEWPCDSSWLWKDAATVLRTHQTHLIVTVTGEPDEGEHLKALERTFAGKAPQGIYESIARVDRTRVLTQVTAAILATCPAAIGVYWTQAKLVVQPEMFLKFATQLIERPYYLWVNFQIGKNAQGKMSGYTIGMESLGLMELETENSPEPKKELHDRLVGIVNYLLDNGPKIRDGDTLGETADEKITVVYADSVFGREGQVMRLEYGGISAPSRPQKRRPTQRQSEPEFIESAFVDPSGMTSAVKIYTALVMAVLALGLVVLTMMIFDPNRDQAKGAPLMIGMGSLICFVLAGTLVWNITQKRLAPIPTILQILALLMSCLGAPIAAFGVSLLLPKRNRAAD